MEIKKTNPSHVINIQEIFRLPRTMSDNAMTWLELTRECNITCDACFHENDPKSQKSLEQIEMELKTMLRLRRCDAMLIAGGEPLTQPVNSIIVTDAQIKPSGIIALYPHVGWKNI